MFPQTSVTYELVQILRRIRKRTRRQMYLLRVLSYKWQYHNCQSFLSIIKYCRYYCKKFDEKESYFTKGIFHTKVIFLLLGFVQLLADQLTKTMLIFFIFYLQFRCFESACSVRRGSLYMSGSDAEKSDTVAEYSSPSMG